jgi:hypothetical protein
VHGWMISDSQATYRFLFFGGVGLSMEQAFVIVNKWPTTKAVCF